MTWKKRQSVFDAPTLLFGVLLLLVLASESALSAPITGMTLAVWFLIFIIALISSLQLPKQAYLAFLAIATLWLLVEIVSSLGTQIGIVNGAKILILLGYGLMMSFRYLMAKK